LPLRPWVALNRDFRGLHRGGDEVFRAGALASGLLLYGMSMIYGATETLDISAVARALDGARGQALCSLFGWYSVSAGVLKLGVVPFTVDPGRCNHGCATR